MLGLASDPDRSPQSAWGAADGQPWEGASTAPGASHFERFFYFQNLVKTSFLAYSGEVVEYIAGSSNGRIVASEAIHLGSSPSPAASKRERSWY